MKGYTHLIWDFNGTILDDLAPSIQSANDLLLAHSLPPIFSVEEYRRQFGFPIVDYYRRLGFDLEKESFADLAVEWVAYYLERTKGAGVFPDLVPALEFFKQKGLCQMILSATKTDMLEGQVESLGIRPYFHSLLGLDNIHAGGKIEIGLSWRRENPEARLLLIGDTDHDAQTAQAMGADCILLACGHQSRAHLEGCPCLFVADSLAQACQRLEQADNNI